MRKTTCQEFNLAPIAAALLLAFGTAHAQQSPEVKEMTTPESVISVGVGGVNNERDAKRFGQYSGLNKTGAALLDIEMIKRDDATGFWTTLTGRNLGLESRELGFSQEKQGDWKYSIDYNETVRYDPYVINTGMTGIGTTTPTINLIQRPAGISTAWATVNGFAASNGVAGHDEELKLKRTALGLSGQKWINSELQFELSFRNEDKKGARMFGRVGIDSSDLLIRPTQGTGAANGGWAVLLTPEPIDSSIRSMEAKLNFNRDKLAISGGYYGSFYVNNNGSLTPNAPDTLNRGALWNGNTGGGASTIQQMLNASVSLPPDNQAHQLYLSGTYAYSQTTRANFKLSYTHATQDENFTSIGLSPSATAPASLGGVVDTTLAQLGLTMRPMKNLSVNASLRYEDRADKTPVYVYNYGATSQAALNGTTNWGSGSQTRTTAKVDGIYRLPAGYTASLGVDWERKVTPVAPANSAIVNTQVFFRPSLDEYGLHGAIRKAMSETLNGALGFEYKQRRGDDNAWVTPSGTAGNALIAFDPGSNVLSGTSTLANKVLPIMYMNRDRSKLRGNLDWEATEKLSFQGVVEHGQDYYNRAWPSSLVASGLAQVVPTVAGAQVISNDSLTLEASYRVSDDWRVNGYWTRSQNRWNVNKANLGDDTKNTADTYGISLRGKVTPRLGLGVDLLMTDDVTSFNNVVSTAVTGQAAGNIAGFGTLPGNYLPNINYNTRKLNLFGNYELDKKSAVRVNLIYQEFKTDDWQWGYNGVPFVYSDNTTVSNPNQTLTFLGVSYIYKFQ